MESCGCVIKISFLRRLLVEVLERVGQLLDGVVTRFVLGHHIFHFDELDPFLHRAQDVFLEVVIFLDCIVEGQCVGRQYETGIQEATAELLVGTNPGQA